MMAVRTRNERGPRGAWARLVCTVDEGESCYSGHADACSHCKGSEPMTSLNAPGADD